jgi:hypothetical protein
MIPPGLRILCVRTVSYVDGILIVRMNLSDGSFAQAYWEENDLRKLMAVHHPEGSEALAGMAIQ